MTIHIHQTFDPAEVEAIAAEIQAGDDDWTYFVKHDPAGTGRSLIGINDEDGIFIEWM